MALLKHNQWVEFIGLLSGASVLADHQCDGQNAPTDGLMLRTCQKISMGIKMGPGLPSLQVKTAVCAEQLIYY